MKDRCEDEIPIKRTARQAAGRQKKAAAPPPPRIPRITRLMALAIKFQDMIDRGEVKDYADLARMGFVTRARLTQIMNLTQLAPEIQESILDANQSSKESAIRRVALLELWQDQDEQFPLSIPITRLNDWPCCLRLRRKGEVFLHLFD